MLDLGLRLLTSVALSGAEVMIDAGRVETLARLLRGTSEAEMTH